MGSEKVSTGRSGNVRLGKNSDVVYNEADVIGRGQFGTVYRGLAPASGTVVAVKLLKNVPSLLMQTFEHTSDHPRRIDHQKAEGIPLPPVASELSPSTATPGKAAPLEYPSELTILCELRNYRCPNIVHVISVWSKLLKPTNDEAAASAASLPASSTSAEDKPSYLYVIVTEYCEGGDLQQFLKARGGALPVHVARSFTYQLCNALLTLKRRRIVHRDVKPANLLLTSADCEVATLKLADFGMAKVAPGSGGSKQRKSHRETDGERGDTSGTSGSLFYSEMGTPMYMSPERLALQPYDYKADVYSAGMVLLEMMRGACVQVKWESQLRSEVPRTIWQELRQYPPDKVPAWLELVQRMTATDPAQRYSVEDVLRHSWFREELGHPLPPLTFPLSEESGSDGCALQLRTAGASVAVSTDAGMQSGSPVGRDPFTSAPLSFPSDQATFTGFAARHCHTDPGVGVDETEASAPAPSTSSSCAGSEVGEHTVHAAREAALPPGESKYCLAEPSKWTVLGVCSEVSVAHNVANGTYTGPQGSAAATEGGSAATVSLPASVVAAAFSLPPGCGPHIITNSVRAFVDAAYLYVLQDELNAPRGLTLVSYLMELMQNGYAAYLKCIEYIGVIGRHTTINNSCNVGGHRFVVRDISLLHNVWRQLMARLHSAQLAYTARLPSHMLSSAVAWRQRLLGAAATPPDDGEDAAAAIVMSEEEVRNVDVSDASITLSEKDMSMLVHASAKPISKADPDAEAVPGVTASLLAAPFTPPVKQRMSTVCDRAERIIFDKAVEYIQSEALSILMDSTTQLQATSLADDLDATDRLEEEEEQQTAQAYQNCAKPFQSHMPVRLPTGDDHTMPPHRGVALLRVLLRRAVLTIFEIGLEAEKPKSANATLLGISALPPSSTVSPSPMPLPDTVAPISADAVAKLVFVVQVPVFGTLDRIDLQTVANLLHTATRVFSTSLMSTS